MDSGLELFLTFLIQRIMIWEYKIFVKLSSSAWIRIQGSKYCKKIAEINFMLSNPNYDCLKRDDSKLSFSLKGS